MANIGEPEDLADVIAFLASDEVHWITAQRAEVMADRGFQPVDGIEKLCSAKRRDWH